MNLKDVAVMFKMQTLTDSRIMGLGQVGCKALKADCDLATPRMSLWATVVS